MRASTRDYALVLALPRILNRSQFRGDDLRRIVLVAFRTYGFRPDAVASITFIEHYGANVTGLAKPAGGTWKAPFRGNVLVKLPRALMSGRVHDVSDVYKILVHEMEHCCGLDHPDMVEWWHIPLPDAVRQLPLRRKKGVLPPTERERSLRAECIKRGWRVGLT